ncbi:MAG: ribonuclease HII, partial [candidate division NC10 bacterium]|nr:ribonuclease HII [candidate division NC10 bacterium]
DQRVPIISAASILAKVTRDRIMEDWAARFPAYGFAQHKGYGTAAHRAAIARHGPSAIHRRTFAGVREYAGVSVRQACLW